MAAVALRVCKDKQGLLLCSQDLKQHLQQRLKQHRQSL